MSENEIIDPSKIHLESVKVISDSINISPDIDKSQIEEFKTNFEVSHGVDPETNSVRFIFHVRLDAINANQEVLPVNADYKTEYIFTVDNLKHFIEKKVDFVILDTNMAATLMGIVFSTTRGIILTRTQGTLMDGVLLPVLNPRNLINSIPKP